MDTSGCLSLRSSRLQANPLSSLKKWKLWSPDIKNAFPDADGFTRDVFLHAPPEWEPSKACRFWKINAPAYGLNDAPVAFRQSPQKHLVSSELSLTKVGMENKVLPFGPCMYSVFREGGGAIGASTANTDGISGCGGPGVLGETQTYSGARFGVLKLQESSFAHVGIEVSQANDYSVRSTQADLTSKLAPLGTSPALWAAKQQLLSQENVLRCQCKSGEPCRIAAVASGNTSRPEMMAAGLARLASKVNSLQGARYPSRPEFDKNRSSLATGRDFEICSHLATKITGQGGCGRPYAHTG